MVIAGESVSRLARARISPLRVLFLIAEDKCPMNELGKSIQRLKFYLTIVIAN
jgi:hypothetical protein